MARCDYFGCAVCDGKAFYDANTDWDYQNCSIDDVRALCHECAKTHELKVVARNSSAPAQQGDDCETCKGSGEVRGEDNDTADPQNGYTVIIECPDCKGTGEQPKAQPSSAEVVAVAWRLSWTEKLGLRMVECFNRRDAAEAMRESKKKFGSHSFLTEPLYTKPIAAVPIPELQAMCERWRDDYGIDDEWALGRKDCADELRALIDKHGKE